ncbi:copper amine oxidase N-terminal domain-containing protein [Paenibacillus lentus]|uniref:Copper amine oxidase N-terminal domain-containing protein n=2 Tax=Paenibacillus lentus TaxID=1338368 RepID=A0A3S8RST6_9BACL|nr:copper amine oxidase N-terminal domain-containing protein [Paenibacillus lentus]
MKMKLKSISLVTALLVSQTVLAVPAVLAQSPVSGSVVHEESLQDHQVHTSTNTVAAGSVDTKETTTEPPAIPTVPGDTDTTATDSQAPDVPLTPEEPAENTDTTDPSGEDGDNAAAPSIGGGQLILHMNSTRMEHDGQVYTSTQPMTVKDGVSYVSIRSLVDRVGYEIAYDSSTKETIIKYGEDELRFLTDSKTYKVNGETMTMKGASYQDNNVFMVPLTSITQALNISYKVEDKKVIMQLSTKPVASFTVLNNKIIAGETTVIYQTKSSSPRGVQIVDEKWEGRQDIFEAAGIYTVSYAVQDANGEWSDPYIQTIVVVNPNIPPVAEFKTDKAEYKMGEPITITDLSYDEDGEIVDRQWMNNYPAFFTPGPVTIQLIVTDQDGASAKVEHTINITTETLYTYDEFSRLFTPVGSNFMINGGEALGYERLPYTYSTEPYTLFKDNGPEPVSTEGVLYRDTITGLTRFMTHHVNKTNEKGKVYIIAKNINEIPANLEIITTGMAGPDVYAEITGTKSVARYFENYQNDSKKKTISLEPGESKIIFEDMHKIAMKPEETISFLGDLYSDSPIEYTSVFVKDGQDPLEVVDTLPVLDPIQSVMRGTFTDSTRIFEHYNTIGGNKNYRLSLTDNAADPFQIGVDTPLEISSVNAGNYGVIYKLKLRVAPRTLITFNPRGGLYMGAALVNGNLVSFSHTGKDNVSGQTSVLHRTGDSEEIVEIWTTPSAGSNLPFSILFMPLPKIKQQ